MALNANMNENCIGDQRTLLTLTDHLTAERTEIKETVALLVTMIVEHGAEPICKT